MTEIPEGFLEEMRQLLKCDVVRISQPMEDMFLVMGTHCSTRDDPGVWVNEKGDELQWDYVHEQVVASGSTIEELRASVQTYADLINQHK